MWSSTILKRNELAEYWEQVKKTRNSDLVLGVNLPAPHQVKVKSIKEAAFLYFLPMYLVATFLKCQGCGKCCRRLNDRVWDRGVVLSREEAASLKKFCSVKKKNGKYLLKYPCPLLKDNNKCRHYIHRPSACRFFPMTTFFGGASADTNQGIMMDCTASKEFYITVQLFLQDWHLYREECKVSGKQSFSIQALEKIKLKYDYNEVDTEEINIIKNIAVSA